MTLETPKETPANHYVDNDKFQTAMLERREQVLAAKEAGLPKPQVSEYIGKCFHDIAKHLAYKSNFISYSYRDEMIGDGIENCLRYLDNYNPIEYSKPFAYFTQINFYAFIHRIKQEKKQAAIKNRIIREIPFETYEIQGHDEGGEFTHAFMEYLQQNDNADTSMFDKKPKKPKKSSEPTLFTFIDEPVEEPLIKDEDGTDTI